MARERNRPAADLAAGRPHVQDDQPEAQPNAQDDSPVVQTKLAQRDEDKRDERDDEQAEEPKPGEPGGVAEQDSDAPTKDGLCAFCWPEGWPNEDTKSANCEHGSWKR